MACGKTTIGALLSKKLKFNFFDSDYEIEKSTKLKVSDIFKKYGERRFRKLETKILKKLSMKNSAVISTGGGTLFSRKNAKIAKKSGLIIFIDTDFEICLKRAEHQIRPLILTKTKKELLKLFKKRQKRYLKISDLHFKNNNGKTECLEKIISSI